MERTKERESGVELLRIIAMVMIVANHLVNHGILQVTSGEPNVLWPGGTSVNRILCALLTSGGRVGVAVFFMISGFFLADQEKIPLRSLKKILGRVHFYGVLMLGCLLALAKTIGYGKELDLAAIARTCLFLPATVWWFAFAYIVLLFLAPSLNAVAASFRHKWSFPVLLLYVWYFFYIALEEYAYADLIRAVFFYLLGTWAARTFGRADRPSRARAGALFCLCLALWVLAGCLSYMELAQDTGMTPVSFLPDLSEPAPVLLHNLVIPCLALALLFLFRDVHFSSRAVNRLAGCTFGIYLFHDFRYMRAFLWHTLLRADTVQYPSRWFPVWILADVLLIFAVGSLLDLGREGLAQLGKRFVHPGGTGER